MIRVGDLYYTEAFLRNSVLGVLGALRLGRDHLGRGLPRDVRPIWRLAIHEDDRSRLSLLRLTMIASDDHGRAVKMGLRYRRARKHNEIYL